MRPTLGVRKSIVTTRKPGNHHAEGLAPRRLRAVRDKSGTRRKTRDGGLPRATIVNIVSMAPLRLLPSRAFSAGFSQRKFVLGGGDGDGDPAVATAWFFPRIVTPPTPGTEAVTSPGRRIYWFRIGEGPVRRCPRTM